LLQRRIGYAEEIAIAREAAMARIGNCRRGSASGIAGLMAAAIIVLSGGEVRASQIIIGSYTGTRVYEAIGPDQTIDYTASSISDSYSGVTSGINSGPFSVSGSADIQDGTLKLETETHHNVFTPTGAVGLADRIYLFGPSDIGGEVTITMHVSGSYEVGSYVNASNVLTKGFVQVYGDIEQYPGNPQAGGHFSQQETSVGSGQLSFDPFVTIAFNPGQAYIDFSAYLGGYAGYEAVLDFSHTATFDIVVPEGFTYSSDLHFGPPSAASVPEPSTLAIFGGALVAVRALRRRGRRMVSTAST
jgi:PEP-CTERM motif